LPDIYAQARGRMRIYQAKHKCLWYKCYVPHCPCRQIARQCEVEIRIYYIDHLGNFDYGPAHASSYTYVCQQKKRANPMESVKSSYKVYYYMFKGLTFFLKQVSRIFRKMGVVLN